MRRHYCVLAVAFLLASCGGRDKQASAVEPSYTQAHDIEQLMAIVVQPQADVFWRSAGTVIDEKGQHDLRPTTDAEWLRVQSAAATLTEMGNLLQTPLYAEGRRKDWMQFAKALTGIGLKAEQAAKDRSTEDTLFEVGGTIYNVCTACHQAYPLSAGETPAGKDSAAATKTKP